MSTVIIPLLYVLNPVLTSAVTNMKTIRNVEVIWDRFNGNKMNTISINLFMGKVILTTTANNTYNTIIKITM